MKFIINYILPTLFIIYLVISFIKIQINFFLWNENTRIIYILMSSFFSFIVLAVYNILKNEKNE